MRPLWLRSALVALGALVALLVGSVALLAALHRLPGQARPDAAPPAPAPVVCAAPPPADVAGDDLAELAVLLDLVSSSQLAARLTCGLQGPGAKDDGDDKGDDKTSSDGGACNDRLSRLEAHLVVAEGAARVARSCEARGDRPCRAVALRVAQGELPPLRRLVASRGLGPLAPPAAAPAGSAP